MNADEFETAIGKARTPDERLSWFGALLAKESRTRVQIVGGSAVQLYLGSSVYVSQDVDLVGERAGLSEVLRRWRFAAVEGRSRRIYWYKEGLGLVDFVGTVSRSGMRPKVIATPFGRVRISPIEPLVMRRLVRSHREGHPGLYRQAVRLARLGPLDWEYLEAEARYEGVVSLLARLRKSIPPARRGSTAGLSHEKARAGQPKPHRGVAPRSRRVPAGVPRERTEAPSLQWARSESVALSSDRSHEDLGSGPLVEVVRGNLLS